MKGRDRRPRICGLILAGLLAGLAKADQEAGEYFRIDHPASIARGTARAAAQRNLSKFGFISLSAAR